MSARVREEDDAEEPLGVEVLACQVACEQRVELRPRVALSTDIAHGADVVLTLPATPALPDLTRDQHGEIAGDSVADGSLVATKGKE